MVNRSIFRQYDIRGRVGMELDGNTEDAIASAFAAYVIQAGRKQVYFVLSKYTTQRD